MLTYIIKCYIYVSMKNLLITLGLLFTTPAFSQVVEAYEAYDVDTLTVYYTKKDTTKNVTLEEGTFINGLRSGIWTSYYSNGKVQAIAYYKQGKKIGKWRSYDNKGRLLTEIRYKKGKIVYASQSRYY